MESESERESEGGRGEDNERGPEGGNEGGERKREMVMMKVVMAMMRGQEAN